MVLKITTGQTVQVKKVKAGRTTLVKKVVVGTPVKRVKSGEFNINDINGVDTSGSMTGSVLVYNDTTSHWESKKELTDTHITGGQY
jgi:hypothetical protein